MIDRTCIFYMCIMSIMISIDCAADYEIEVNYDVGNYKLLQVNQTLELICKNKLNRYPPSWRYSSRLHNDPRMKLTQDVGESRLVISNAKAEDAGNYMCLIDHEYNGETFHYNKTIEVIVNEIKDVKVEEEKDSIKLLCDVRAYPSAKVTWKIDYDKEEMKPQQDEPDEADYWIPPSDDEHKHVIDKTEGRWTLREYKGVSNAELIIADVTDNDNGKYYCVAQNLAGVQCKECNVTRSKRGVAVEGKSTSATSGNGDVVETETENSNDGINDWKVPVIAVFSLFISVFITVTIIYLCIKHIYIRRKEEMLKRKSSNKIIEDQSSTPLNSKKSSPKNITRHSIDNSNSEIDIAICFLK